MRAPYIAVGISALALPLILSGNPVYSEPKEPAQQQVQVGDTLENRVLVINNLTSVLLKRGVTPRELDKLVEEQLRFYGILTAKDYMEVAKKVEQIKRGLDTRFYEGLREQYIALPNTPLSKEAQQDIADYSRLKAELDSHLKQKLGGRILTSEEYFELVRDSESSKMEFGAYIKQKGIKVMSPDDFDNLIESFVSKKLPPKLINLKDVVASRLIVDYEMRRFTFPHSRVPVFIAP